MKNLMLANIILELYLQGLKLLYDKNMSNKIISLLILTTILVPVTISAQMTIENPLGSQNMELWQLIDKIIDFIFYATAVVVPIIILIAAFKLLTSAGEVEKIQTAKKMIVWTILGLILILASYSIIVALDKILT